MKLILLFLNSILLLLLINNTNLVLSNEETANIDCSLVRCGAICPDGQEAKYTGPGCCDHICCNKVQICNRMIRICQPGEIPKMTCCGPSCSIPVSAKPTQEPCGICPAYIRYCKPGEVPSGCCPCTPQLETV